jgi:hypothetical protein
VARAWLARPGAMWCTRYTGSNGWQTMYSSAWKKREKEEKGKEGKGGANLQNC